MTRWLFLLALALYVIYLVPMVLARLRNKLAELSTEPTADRRVGGEALVACVVCGVHVPRQRAYAAIDGGGGRPSFFCSEACRRRAPAAGAVVGMRSA